MLQVEFIHCIQMLPFLPVTEHLLPEEWIKEEYPVLAEAYSRPDPPLSEEWKGYIVMAHAVIDPITAYQEALQLTSYDNGNSKTNALYWIATRPGMEDGPTQPPGPSSTSSTSTTHGPLPHGCCQGEQSVTDPSCNDIPHDPWGGLGCDACGIQDCRFCGDGWAYLC